MSDTSPRKRKESPNLYRNMQPQGYTLYNTNEITLSSLNAPKICNYVKEVANDMGLGQGFFYLDPVSRNELWNKAKYKRLEDQRKLQAHLEVSQCTFVPNTLKKNNSDYSSLRGTWNSSSYTTRQHNLFMKS